MAKVKQGDRVRINFTGRLEDGTIFDTTVEEAGCSSDDCVSDDCGCETGPMELTIGAASSPSEALGRHGLVERRSSSRQEPSAIR
jgi:FKBP-type peptidyl-prolyl cis-trans isomerase 2